MRTAALALALALGTCAPAGAAVRALVVGVDRYAAVPPLKGAVNDARDVAAVLARDGVETTVLTDAAATRAAVVDAFERLVREGAPGDLIYFHFSGHGISLPDDNGDEADGRDESYLLQDFDEVANPGEQLVDDDLDALFRTAAAAGREVLFVADACHSGSPARAVAPGALPTRLYRPKVEPTRPKPVEGPAVTAGERAGILVAGATLDGETIPEILIDGKPRGALSYAAARALEGRADLDGDGTVSAREFELYVRQAVRTLAASKQTPQFEMGDGTRRILAVGPNREETALAVTAAPVTVPPLPRAFVHVVPGPRAAAVAAAVADPAGVTLVDSPEQAALVLDPATGTALNPVRDVVATAADPAEDFPRIVEAARVLDALGRLALDDPLTLSFAPDDRVQPAGTEIAFRVDGPALPYLTVFDLTATGSVHLLWPTSGADRDPWPGDERFEIRAAVTPPFGADTVVVVATATPPDTLRAALAGAAAGVGPATVYAGLVHDLAGRPHRIGLQAFFTAETRP